jgi:glutamate/aspartate transport system substrate-binding protein
MFRNLMVLLIHLSIFAAWISCAHAQQTSDTRNLTPISGAKRLALVIGNDAYQKVSKLEKAGNDASAMARELKSAGFDVSLYRDLNYQGMVRAVEAFSNRINGGDQVAVFFAGHGVQIKTGSYLLPIDIEAGSESQVEKTAYGLADLTDKLSEAKASFALVMVDACRDNPLKSKGRSVGATRGLSAIEPPKGQMVVYSASKGQQALDRLSDNDSNPNGVFTRSFIARMKKPGVRIEDMMREVQDAVEELAQSVNHEQRPAIYNESRGNFYFFGPTTVQVLPAAPAAATKPPPVAVLPAPTFVADPESQFWNEVKAKGAREYYDAYLKQYPRGKYGALAKLELKKLGEGDRAARAREAAEREQAAEREKQDVLRSEQLTWDAAKAGNSASAYAGYLQRYPEGRFSKLAMAGQQLAQREEAERNKQEVVRRRLEDERRQAEGSRQKPAAERERRETELSASELGSGVLKKIKDSGSITLGIRESSLPLSYLDDKQQPVGYHIDICNRIVDAVKTRLNLPAIKVTYTPVTSQNRIPLVTNGTVDLECGSTTNNEARQKQVAFAPTTFVTNVRMAVKKASGIKSLDQLNGKPVATTTGTTSVQLMRAHEKGKHIDFKEVYAKDHADAFLMLETDRAVAFVMDDNLLAGLMVTSKNPNDYAIVGEVLNIEPIAIMLRRDDPAFKKVVDDAVKALMKSGEIDKLYARWFMSPIPPKSANLNFAMSDKLKELIKTPSDAPAEAHNKK